MIFFGWGKDSKSWQVSASQTLTLRYAYFHVFWLFRLTIPGKYSMATNTEQSWNYRDLSAEEASEVRSEYAIGWWWRWGLLVVVAVTTALAIAAGVKVIW